METLPDPRECAKEESCSNISTAVASCTEPWGPLLIWAVPQDCGHITEQLSTELSLAASASPENDPMHIHTGRTHGKVLLGTWMNGQMSADDIPNQWHRYFIIQMKMLQFVSENNLEEMQCFQFTHLGWGINNQGRSSPRGRRARWRKTAANDWVWQAVLPQEQDNLREQDLEPTGAPQAL